MRVNAGFGELGRHCSRKGPASKMLRTADQVGGVQRSIDGRFNRGNDAVVEESVATVWRVCIDNGGARGIDDGVSSIEYRVSGWMDWCFKRWTMGGKNTLLLLRQQRTISRVDSRQELGPMGTRWSRRFAGNLEDMGRGLFGVLDAFLTFESGLTRSVACHCRCRPVGAGKLLIDTLQRGLSGVDPASPQLELSALQGGETLQLQEAAVSQTTSFPDISFTTTHQVSTVSLLGWYQQLRCRHQGTWILTEY